MKKSTEIRQELSGIVSSQNAIIEKAKTENREALSTEERTAFDGFQTRINDLKGQLTVAEAHEENVRSFGATATSVFEGGASRSEEKEKENIQKRFSISRALRLAENIFFMVKLSKNVLFNFENIITYLA